MLGREASEVERLADEDGDGFERVFSGACFKTYKFRVRAKLDTYEDRTRVLYQALDAKDLDRDEEITWMKARICQMASVQRTT